MTARDTLDVHDDLRRRILTLDLVPGRVLSRAELQEEYAVSSTPVRDAMLQLQAEGLIEVRPQSRSAVTRIELGCVEDALFLRISLETDLLRVVCAAGDPALVARLNHLLAMQEGAAREDDVTTLETLDHAFHRTLFEATGRVRLFDLVRRESVHIDRLRALERPLPGRSGGIVAEHRGIIAAIEARDPDEAARAMEAHLSQVMGIAEDLRRERPDFFAP